MIKNKLSTPFAFLLLILFSNISYSKTELVTVTSQGSGQSRYEAIQEALVTAIGKVNGTKIASETQLAFSHKSIAVNDSELYTSEEAIQKSINSTVNGIVKSWTIISAIAPQSNETLSPALWEVDLDVTLVQYQESKQNNRLRIAVAPFQISSEIKSLQTANRFKIKFNNSIVNYLTQTRRFAVLDRKYTNDQNSELNKIQGANYSTDELAKLGHKLGTDYLIVGSINNIKYYSNTISMRTSDKSITKKSSKLDFSYRIIDVATGLIKYSDEFTQRFNGHISTKTMAEIATNNIGQIIVNAIYPIRVVNIRGDSLTIGQGGKTLKKGQFLKLLKYGDKIFDPYTQESLGNVEIKIGTVEITNVRAKTSTARLIESTENITADSSNVMIIRPIKGKKPHASPKKTSSPIRATDKKIPVNFEKDDDW